MTETKPTPRRRPPVRRPTFIGGWPLAVVTSLAIFLLAFAWLAWRVRTGADPVLGKAVAKAAPAPAKRIRRVIVVRRVVVTELPPKSAAGSAAAPAVDTAPRYTGGNSYAPARTAPAPAPEPAPVTRGS